MEDLSERESEKYFVKWSWDILLIKMLSNYSYLVSPIGPAVHIS
jgi:hypothetical protein